MLDPKKKTSRVWEPIFLALDPRARERSLHNAKNKPPSGLRERKRHVRPEKEDKPGLGAHFSCARPGKEDKSGSRV